MSVIKRIIGSLAIAAVFFAFFSMLHGNGASMIHDELFSALGFVIIFFFMWIEWEFLRL